MKQLSAAAVERAMKLQDVMLRAMAKRITWFQAAEILGISCRQMQRWKTRFEHEGYEGLFDRRRGLPSSKATESDKNRRFPQRLGKVRPKSSLTFPHFHSHYCWINI